MPRDDLAPPPRPAGAAPSSRNAVRGGILAGLSTQAAPPPETPGAAAAPAPAQPPPPPEPPPRRGLSALLRAAGRRGLRAARPVAAPFLHRVQMRMRTAVNESDVAARAAGIEQALADLAERLDADAARWHEVAEVKRLVAETARRLDAADAAAAAAASASASAAAEAARRMDAVQERLGGASQRLLQKLDAVQERLDGASQRLDAVRHGVAAVPDALAAVPDAVQARLARRPPIPLGPEVMAWTPDGYLLLPAEDLRLLAAMSEGGVLEPGTRRVLASLLRPGGAFLDVGAHVGTMALLAARRVGEGGRVFAVEPLPRLAALLRRSAALNDVADRVSVSACAAGDEDAEALIHIGDVMGHSSLLPLPEGEGTGTATVPVRRMDDVVPAGTALDAVKIDAEGLELQVWRGMRRVLDESPDLAAVLEFGPSHLARAGVSPEAWLGELEAAGFEAHAIDEATGACRRTTAAALAERFSTNVLLLRPGAGSRHPDLMVSA